MSTLTSGGMTSIQRAGSRVIQQGPRAKPMPFMIVRRGDQHCVFTQDESGNPKGTSHGCHPTREKAIAQLRALYANVPEARKDDNPTGSQGKGERYADPGYQGDKQPRYPVTKDGKVSAERVRAAWNYIHHADNRKLYTAQQLSHIEGVIRAAAKEAGVEIESGKNADYVIRVGPAIKAMGEGMVGGYLVQFGSDATKDAEDEWFTPETDFDTDFPSRASIYYNHGMDPVVGRARLAHGTMKADEIGIWVEAQLDLRNRHQAAMYGMAKAGKLGWSSGSLAHLTDPPREHPGGAIKNWPLGHDASLTPIPSDKRNAAIALKSWEPPPLAELAADPAIKNQSLAENTDRWMDDGMTVLSGYTSIAAKAGRKLSAARRSRLNEMRQIIDDLLNETEPQEAATESAGSPTPGMGEGDEVGKSAAAPAANGVIELPITSVPDLHDLYAAATRQSDRTMTLIRG